jgi:hypothetical protein
VIEMSRGELFEVIAVGAYVLPLCLALAAVALPRPQSRIIRSALAVGVAWAASVVYTMYVYNPAGIAAWHELGWDSPEMRFDNNTVAAQLLMGWFYPAIAVGLFLQSNTSSCGERARGISDMPSNNALQATCENARA